MKLYKLALLKAYFDEGYSVTSYFKYLIAFYGMASLDVKTTLTIGIIYGLSCFGIGWLVFITGFKDAMLEVRNRFDPFVKQMRNSKIFKARKR